MNFSVKITNYDQIEENARRTDLEAQWYAQIPSSYLYGGWPIRYLQPSDGRSWRPLTESCLFSAPEGSEYFNPYPYLSVWIAAGPLCEGVGWRDENCRSYGLIHTSGLIEVSENCLVVYDYEADKITVEKGEAYFVRVTVTNQSIRGGVAVEATLGIGISAATPTTTLISPQVTSESFAPNETKVFEYSLSVPTSLAGETGLITAWVEDPTGRAIASATEELTL